MKHIFTKTFAVLILSLGGLNLQAQIPDGPDLTWMFFEDGLIFNQLTWFGGYPGIPGAFMAIQRGGKITLIDSTASGYTKNDFLEINIRTVHEEQGLLGIAFHPNFLENRKYYINYTNARDRIPEDNAPEPFVTHSYIEQRTATEDFRSDDGGPGVEILSFRQDWYNHNGGELQFGLDGYLYAGFGDGGDPRGPDGNFDLNNNGQSNKTLMGSMLRIDVDNPSEGRQYGIPEDNPFYNDPDPDVRQEIWAWGLRNPWRFSFDRLTGELWAGDVGENNREEISIVEKGKNYGWRIMEGNRCNRDEGVGCDHPSLTPPVVEWGRGDAWSITGGFVYRGNPESPSYGVYICADYGSDEIFAITAENGVMTEQKDWGRAAGAVSTFGTDAKGNIYMGLYDGRIYKLELGPTAPLEMQPSQSFLKGIDLHYDKMQKTFEVRSKGSDIQSITLIRTDGKLVKKVTPNTDLTVMDVPRGMTRALVLIETQGLMFAKSVHF